MVGVPKSSGCKTCKKRRLKCDESWPECLRCQKIKQPCPGTTSLLTFKDGRPKATGSHAGGSTDKNAPGVVPSLQRGPRPKKLQMDLTILDSKWSESGALSQKWRIKTRQESLPDAPALQQDLDSTIQTVKEQIPNLSEDYGAPEFLRCPTDSARYKLARALVATFEGPDTGHKLTAFGKYVRDIPRYVGESPALDAAAACLADAHSNMMRNHRSCEGQVADPVLYLKALQRLQEALIDPNTGMSTYTLAATTLLGIVEIVGGSQQDSKYLSHAGGTTKLIEVRGPSNHVDEFASDVLRSQRGKIIVQSLWNGTNCFLESGEWQTVAFLDRGLTETDAFQNKVLKHLIHIPRILKDYRELRCSPSTILPLDILFRLREMRSSLRELGYELETRLRDESIVTETPSRFGCMLVPVCWDFKDWPEAQIYSHYWALVIIVNQLFGEMTATHDHDAISRDAAYNICKLYECSWTARPFGSHFMVMSLSLAFHWVDHDLQRWIIDALNELGDAKSTGAWWSPLTVEYVAGVLTGRRPPANLDADK